MKKIHYIGLALLAFVLCCRWFTPVADFYATRVYPLLSAGLSFSASVLPFSLEEIVVLGFVAAFIYVLVRTLAGKKSFWWYLGKNALVVMWLVVWLYMGWMGNYYRTPLRARLEIPKVLFSEDAFNQFLYDYTDSLNDLHNNTRLPHPEVLEADIKAFYNETLPSMGYTRLRSWQHPKKPLFNRLYSAVSVSGFMGPFFCETHVNLDVPEGDYPFTLAHELAHLAGVTSEAEANYWAYAYCTHSGQDALRFCGYYSIFPHVAVNVHSFMTEEYYAYWIKSIHPDIRDRYSREQAYWDALRVPVIDRIQSWMMDASLRHNGISSGAREYSEVVSLILTMEAWEKARQL
jgi:hypothetical protein